MTNTVLIDWRRWGRRHNPTMVYPAYGAALRAHLDAARPRSALESDAAPGDGRWPLRRMLAWVVAVAICAWLAWAYAALWVYWLG